MSLDSVELLVSFEKYFGIDIPDKEAEKISTVHDMVESAARHLNISQESDDLEFGILERINTGLKSVGLVKSDLQLTDKIFSVLDPKNKGQWSLFSGTMGLKIPAPYLAEKSRERIFSFIPGLTASYNWKEVPLAQFVRVIGAANLDRFVKQNAIKTKYEILLAVTSITADKTGVDFYEIEPWKSFTNDFGID